MPKSHPYRTDAAIKLDVYEQGFGPIKWTSYRFTGYAEAPAILQFLRNGLERCPPPATEKQEEK